MYRISKLLWDYEEARPMLCYSSFTRDRIGPVASHVAAKDFSHYVPVASSGAFSDSAIIVKQNRVLDGIGANYLNKPRAESKVGETEGTYIQNTVTHSCPVRALSLLLYSLLQVHRFVSQAAQTRPNRHFNLIQPNNP